VRVCDFEAGDFVLWFGPGHRKRGFCHVTKHQLSGWLRSCMGKKMNKEEERPEEDI
jgi:hypothetical protein